MSIRKSNISWLGLGLIVVGAILLLGKFNVLHLRFSTIFWPCIMILSMIGVSRGFTNGKRGKIFWGTVGFLLGLFFLLKTSDMVEIQSRLFVPAVFLIVGIAFFMAYLAKVKDWFFLIPAGIATGVGSLFLLADLDYLSYYDVADTIRTYWPVVLILFGLIFLFRRKNGSQGEQPVSS